MSSLVQKVAPDFRLLACMPDDSFEEIELSSYRGRHVVLFVYPCDFDCASAEDIFRISERQSEFEARGVQLLGLSCDTHLAHRAWKALPQENGGCGNTVFPLLSDVKKETISALGCMQDNGLALPSCFIIDGLGVVRVEMKYSAGITWSTDEVLRVIDALSVSDRSTHENMTSSADMVDCLKLDKLDADPKITDLSAKAKHGWFSFEFFPPKTDDGVMSLHRRIDRMKKLGPLCVNFTWGPGGSTSELTCSLAEAARNEHGCVAALHLCCTNQEPEVTHDALERMRAAGVRNLVALRGDALARSDATLDEANAKGHMFSCALDLIKYTRKHFKDFFCIAVAGYPEGHSDVWEQVQDLHSLSACEKRRANLSEVHGRAVIRVCRDTSFKKELDYLKEKCDAGGEFIITSACLDADVYCDFVKACRELGIQVPIIPGIMCMASFSAFQRLCTQTCYPEGMLEAAENAAKISDDAFKAWLVDMTVELCRSLLDRGAPGLHFYTLNLEKVVLNILLGLELVSPEQALAYQQSDAETRQSTPSPSKR
jgi:methylenetetrahydrofolate reductase (NADPH)